MPSNRIPSDRKFGFTFAAIFTAISLYGSFASWRPTISALCAVAGASFLLLGAIAPQRLSRLNSAWFAFGEVLARILSPLILGILFFALITPVSIVGRLLGRDELRLKRRATLSYWVPRHASELDPTFFQRQF